MAESQNQERILNMRIAFYYESTTDTGGVNRVVTLIASGLVRRGYEVHLIGRYKSKTSLYDIAPGVVIHELYPEYISKYKTFFSEYRKLRRIVRENGIDVLVSTGGPFFLIARWIKGVRHFEWDHVSFWHGDKLTQLGRRWAARLAEKIIVLTDDNRDAFRQIKGCSASVVRIFNPRSYSPVSMPSDEKENLVLAVGYIGVQKGYDLLLQAWNKISADLQKDWKLLIVGEDRTQMLAGLQHYVKENGLQNVEFSPFRNDVPELMQRAKIYVNSSRWEGLPMVMLEAQAFGLPIIAFDCKTGPRDIVLPDTGILVAPEDITGFTEALERMMRDTNLQKSCAARALESSKRFDLQTILDQWEKVLQNR